jgi:hypothetical protein
LASAGSIVISGSARQSSRPAVPAGFTASASAIVAGEKTLGMP